ncbi:pentapeptide repeat-containing protein [Candidatus Tisiphia endosymbiont of Empis tessellata]|uniref:WD40 domain-containing protein n=1 Tax=Candidatus Tisiphia endosymbiont of Empis tessellata TaxID=3066259 RepID=UPI00313AA9C6
MSKEQMQEVVLVLVGGKITNINEVKTTLDSKDISNEKKFNLLEQVLSDPSLDKYEKLDLGIKYLNNLKNPKAEKYISASNKIMEKLHKAFQGDELYKPWVRYFDVSCKVEAESIKGAERNIFISGISILVQELLFENENDQIDWRITKKMLEVGDILFEEDSIDILQEDLFKPIKAEIEKAIEFLLWKDPNIAVDSTKLTTDTLKTLKNHFSDQNKFNQLKEAILTSRFDKEEFNLPSTVIMGEDGGMYLLLNNLSDNEQVIKEVASSDYLKDKLQGGKQQITIGKGGFGTVRFALSLFDAKSKPGDLICIKKTKSINSLEPSYEQIIDTTLRDYFTNDVADIIYAPSVFDMALVTDRNVGQNHRKGYLMMEVLPQNTATKVFANPNYQKWEYQKPYLLDVFQKTRDLLGQNVAMTDLKPDNTLYDTDTRKATIIDLGGIVKIDKEEEKTKFNICKYFFQHTKEFSAPELQQDKGIIDVETALSFACGRIIEDITKVTDIDHDQVKVLVNSLIQQTPENRSSIKDAIKGVKKIGDDNYKKNIIFTHYINKIKERLKSNKSSISINEDIENLISDIEVRKLVSNQNIENTKNLYIELYSTGLDPYRYAKLKTDILSSKIDNFWGSQKEVMLLLGVAGAGKSITLQLKFIEAVKNWKIGDPLPIYFNLASNIDLVKIIDSINNALGTNLKLNDLKNAHLYIDSFDEGLGIATSREVLIKDYIKKLENPKILISCRTDYLPSNNDYNWFMPESKQLEVCYIAPINYSDEQKLEDYVSQYVKYVDKCNNDPDHDEKYYLDRIAKLKIEPMIDTGFMFTIVMQTIPSIHIPSTEEKPITRQDIYDEYLKIQQGTLVEELHKNQQDEMLKLLLDLNIDHKKTPQELELNQLLKELGKYIAMQLHLPNEFRIKDDSELFKAFGYEESTLFTQQALYHILKLLPLKIETKTSASKVQIKQEVEIGFAHVIFKNYYLFEVIKDEVEKSEKSEILASHSIVKDVDLIKLIAEDLVYDKNLQKFLRQAVKVTKRDKSDEAVTLAANSITLLIAAQYSFSGEDLSNISIKGANIRNGIFQYVDFSNADLTEVNLTNTNLVGAKFIGTNMTDIKLSIHPDLEHNAPVYCLSYSPDGKYLASGSTDNTVKIWDAKNGKLLQNLEGHTWYIKCIRYSPDGKYLASGSTDNTVKIWNAKDGRLLQNLEGHTRYGVKYISYSHDGKQLASGSCYMNPILEIWNVENPENDKNDRLVQNLKGHTCISYSPDGKYFASGSLDKTVITWDIENSKLFQTLTGHTSGVKCISYSPDGKYLASSEAHTIKIWNAENGNLFQNLNEQTDVVRDIRYSPDGQYLAVSSVIDNTVKIWNATNGKLLHNLEKHMYVVTCISYSPDGQYLASGFQDNIVKIWDAKNGSLLQTLITHLGRVECISYSPDGKYLASGYSDIPRVKIWNIKDYMLLQNIAGHSTNVIRCLSYSPDGKYLASGSEDCTVKIWNVEDGRLLKDFKEHTNIVYCLSYSPDGKYLASGSYDKTVKIWDVENSRLLKEIREHTDIVECISYSPDGKYFASGSLDKTVIIWDIKNGRLQNLKGHAWSIKCISYSPDGQYLASGSYDHTVKIWNVEDGRLLYNLTKHTDTVECISYSHDGKYLTSCSCDKTVRIWNATNGKLLKTLEGYSNGPQRVSYSPDGQYLALCSNDNTVKVWYIKDWYCVKFFSLLKNLEESTTSGRCLSYSPDGQYLASGSSAIKIWDIKNGRLLKHLTGHIAEISCISYSPDGKYLASGSDDATLNIWEKRTNLQSKKVVWHLIKEISASESPLLVEDVTIENTVISTKNQRVFEQKGAKVADNVIGSRENKAVNLNKDNASKKINNKKPHTFLEKKLDAATEQKALKLVKVKSKFIKEPIKVDISTQNDYTSVNVLEGIKYDNPLLNNSVLLKKLASNLNININKAIDASDYLTNLFGSKDFNYICNSDQNLLQELLGNYCEY